MKIFQTACLQRAEALIQANVQYAVKDANKDFDITKSNTIVHIHATAKMGTLLPWAVASQTDSTGGSSVNPDATSIGKNYVKISYDGINGY